MSAKKRAPKRRNAYAASLRRYGRRIKPSGKVYRRKDKHKSPHRSDGGFSFPAGGMIQYGETMGGSTRQPVRCSIVTMPFAGST